MRCTKINLITLYFVSLLQISCIYQASLLPLKQNTIIKNNNNYEEQQLKSYYYPSSSQRANEVHDLPLIDDDVDDSVRTVKKSEMMESSASNYYTSNQKRDDEDDYSTGSLAADAILHENFESEKIKPSDNSKVITQRNLTEVMTIVDDVNYKPNITQLQVPNLDNNNNHSKNSNDNSNKFSKLLFSSPSATVSTSNGPSVCIHILYICFYINCN